MRNQGDAAAVIAGKGGDIHHLLFRSFLSFSVPMRYCVLFSRLQSGYNT